MVGERTPAVSSLESIKKRIFFPRFAVRSSLSVPGMGRMRRRLSRSMETEPEAAFGRANRSPRLGCSAAPVRAARLSTCAPVLCGQVCYLYYRGSSRRAGQPWTNPVLSLAAALFCVERAVERLCMDGRLFHAFPRAHAFHSASTVDSTAGCGKLNALRYRFIRFLMSSITEANFGSPLTSLSIFSQALMAVVWSLRLNR